MRVETNIKDGVVNIELYGNDEKDIAILTSIFNRSSINKSFRFRARPTRVIKDGSVCAVVINNDPYITRKYLSATGFYKYINTNTNNSTSGIYYVKDNILMYNRINSNVYVVYENGKLKTETIDGKSKYTIVQIDTSKPISKYNIRKVSELDNILIYKKL